MDKKIEKHSVIHAKDLDIDELIQSNPCAKVSSVLLYISSLIIILTGILHIGKLSCR